MKTMERMQSSSHAGRRADGSHMLESGRSVTHPEEVSWVAHLADSLLALDVEAREIALTLKRPTRILVVNSDHTTLRQIDACLLAEGYGVVPASTFEEATELLQTLNPHLVVTDVRLGAFNGLHLATRSLHYNPSRPVIITHHSYDRVLERDARDIGAAFIVKPLDNPDFLLRVRAAFDEDTVARRWRDRPRANEPWLRNPL